MYISKSQNKSFSWSKNTKWLWLARGRKFAKKFRKLSKMIGAIPEEKQQALQDQWWNQTAMEPANHTQSDFYDYLKKNKHYKKKRVRNVFNVINRVGGLHAGENLTWVIAINMWGLFASQTNYVKYTQHINL